MNKRAIWALAAAVCLAAPAAIKAQGDYLDVYTVKVKPEKIADFEAISKKWVSANHRFNGDHWIAMETMYGEGGVYVFVSPRKDYADVDTMRNAAMTAAAKAFGKEATDKLGIDFQNCLVWSRSELRRRRMDLSRKAPTDMEAYAKLIGESRVLRTTAVHVKTGHVAEYEALLKELKEAGEKNADTQPVLVSQVVEGSRGSTFYITSLRSAMGGFDKNPTMRDLLGEEGFNKFQQKNAEVVQTAESALYGFTPELSNPPEEIAKVAADFWQPKQTMVATRKAKAPAGTPAEVKPAAEKPKP